MPLTIFEGLGKKIRNAIPEFGQFCLGAGIALVVLGLVTGAVVLGLLVFEKFVPL